MTKPYCARTLRMVARWHGRQSAKARAAAARVDSVYHRCIDVNHTYSARHFDQQAKAIEKPKRKP